MKPSVLATELPFLIENRRPVFLWGKSGVGKSSVVNQIAQAMGRKVSDARMSQLDSIDLRGFPMPDTKKKTMEWLPADFLPRAGDPPGILFLDEFNGAMPATASAGYQLILDLRIGAYVLPKNWSIVAAGNGQDDRGITYQMAAPLSNRFVHLEYTLDSDDWQARASVDDIDPRIRAFLRLKPGALHIFDSTVNPRSFPTPRTWYFADEIVKAKRAPAAQLELLKGCIGEGAAVEFTAFCTQLKDMPDIDQIMLDPKKAPLPVSQPVMHAVVCALADRTKAANFPRIMDYVERMQREFQTVFIHDVGKREKPILSTRRYADWILANQHVIN